MSTRNGGVAEVTETGLRLPEYRSGTVTYGPTTATYAFFSGAAGAGTKLATLTVTFDGDPTTGSANMTAWSVAFPV